MEDRETARMHKYGESKMTRIMMATVPHIISGLGLRKFQADGFLLTRVYNISRWLSSVTELIIPDKRICLSFEEPVKCTASKTSLNGKKLTIVKK